MTEIDGFREALITPHEEIEASGTEQDHAKLIVIEMLRTERDCARARLTEARHRANRLAGDLRAACYQLDLGTDHAPYDYVPLLVNQVNLWRRRAKQAETDLTRLEGNLERQQAQATHHRAEVAGHYCSDCYAAKRQTPRLCAMCGKPLARTAGDPLAVTRRELLERLEATENELMILRNMPDTVPVHEYGNALARLIEARHKASKLIEGLRTACHQLGLGTDHALHDYVPLLVNEVDLKRRRAERAEADLARQTALTTHCHQVLEQVTGALTAADASIIAGLLPGWSDPILCKRMTALAEALAALERSEGKRR